MLKKALLLVAGIVLLVLPIAARWLYYYEGRHSPGPVPRPDVARLQAATPQLEPFVDGRQAVTPGTVLLDLAHNNQVSLTELNVLQARLAARGQQLEVLEPGNDAPGLASRLRYAKALVIISPGEDWQPAEVKQVQEFVAKGGRLLLVTDPTHFEVVVDEQGTFAELQSDVTHINGLAAQFGVVFQPDYLYNTVENEGNFRNIYLRDFGGHDLTQGLNQVVFYAVHSLVSEELALMTAGGATRSSDGEHTGDLVVAVLAAHGDVLALGDSTFMMEPYSYSYDNDQFVANIADWLSGVQRRYRVTDFPFFFDRETQLIYAGGPRLDGDLVQVGSKLQNLFASADKELLITEAEDQSADALFVGLYDEADAVATYLADAGVTLWITPTNTLERHSYGAQSLPLIPSPAATPSPSGSDSPGSATSALTASPASARAATPILGPPPQQTSTPPSETLAPTDNWLHVQSLGEVSLPGTALFLLDADDERYVMVVLADTQANLNSAIERLSTGDLGGCLLEEGTGERSTVVLCSTAGTAEPGEPGERRPPTPLPAVPSPPITSTVPAITTTVEPQEPGGDSQGRVLIIALDDGQGAYEGLTSTDEYVAILNDDFDLTVWSTAGDGPPSASEVLDYDLVIWTAGDFPDAFGDDERQLLFVLMLKGVPVIISGAYVGDTDNESVQRDLQVQDSAHPLATGFDANEIIDFVPSPSGADYEIDVLGSPESDEGTVVFARGPGSEDPGAPAIVVVADEFTGMKSVTIGLPLYLLPEGARRALVLNAATWMLEP